MTWNEQRLGDNGDKAERNGLKQGGGEKLAAPGTAHSSRKSDIHGHSQSGQQQMGWAEGRTLAFNTES